MARPSDASKVLSLPPTILSIRTLLTCSTRPPVSRSAGFTIVRAFARAYSATGLLSANHVPLPWLETVDLLLPSHTPFVGPETVGLMKSLPRGYETLGRTRFSVHSQPLLDRRLGSVIGGAHRDIAKRGRAIGSKREGGERKRYRQYQPPCNDKNLLQHPVFLWFAAVS